MKKSDLTTREPEVNKQGNAGECNGMHENVRECKVTHWNAAGDTTAVAMGWLASYAGDSDK